MKHQKHQKIDDFDAYCKKKQIQHDRSVIFDDNDSVWASDNFNEVVKHFINNLHEHLSFFYKLTFSLAQVILYNEKINIDLRKSVAEELTNLLSHQSPVLYQSLSQKLNEFISRPEQTLDRA
jgi:hypothetical protein